MNSFEIIKGQGGIGRQMSGKDHVCGLLVFMPETDAQRHTEVVAFGAYNDCEDAYGEESGIGYKVLLYQLSEIFRINSGAKVWVKIASAGSESPYDDADLSLVKSLQEAASGECRQIGVWNGFATGSMADLQLLQNAASELESVGSPCSIVYASGGDTTSWVQTATFKRTAGYSNVSWLIGQDLTEGSKAAEIAAMENAPAVSALGALMGCISKAAVNESIAWVAKFNVGYESVGFVDKKSNAQVGIGNMDTLDSKGFIFLTTYDGLSGSYFQDSHTMDVETSDYATIENERAIDKACRGVRTYLLPYLASPIYISDDGTMRADSLAVLRNEASRALEAMERAGELSGYKVEIDPEQNVLANSTVEFVIKNVAVGVMRHIKVKIGYTTSID